MNNKQNIFYFIIGITFFRLLIINFFPLLGDEAYYWQWSNHLDFSYYEQGPILAFIIYLFTFFNKINTFFTVRLGAVIFSSLTLIFCYLIYKKIYQKDNKNIFFLLLLISSSFFYAAISILMMHDTIMVFFFSVFLYVFLFIIEKPEENKLWVLAGLIFALAIMSKFTIILIYPAIFIFIILSNFKKYIKGFIFFTISTLIFLSPVIYWNFTHNFANLKYLMIRSNIKTNFYIKYFIDFILGQFLILNPFIFLLLFTALFNKFKEKFLIYEKFFFIIFIFPFIFFILFSFKSKIEANWPGFIYLPLFFLTINYFYNNQNIFFKKFFNFSIFLSIILCLFLHTFLPFYHLTPFSNSSNALSKSIGYKNIAKKIKNIYNQYKTNKNLFLATRHYQVASLISFYLNNKPMVYILINHESAKNYRYWQDYKNFLKYDCIFIYSEPWESYEMEKFFEKKLEKFEIIKEHNKTFYLDYLINFKGIK